MLGSADRQIMAILLVPVQKEFGASDTAMGVLTGVAFSVVYATIALPLARLADTRNRRNIMSIAIVAWSGLTVACGTVTSYIWLLFARAGVAAAEAPYQPTILSMIGDLYPRERRGLAVGLLTVGTTIGFGVGTIVAGRVSEVYGWRAAFMVLGVPGVIVGLLALLTLPEPKRGAFEGAPHKAAEKAGFLGFGYLWRVRTVRRLLLANILMQASFQGFNVWLPAFFIRVHGMSQTEMAATIGGGTALGGIGASLLAGVIADRLARNGERWRSYYCAACLFVGIPLFTMTLFAPTPVAIAGVFIVSLTVSGAISAALTACLGIVRSDMRGSMVAAMTFSGSVLGALFGPLVIGRLSDYLKPTVGDDSLRWALLAIPVLYVAALVGFLASGRSTDRDAEAALRP